MTEERWPTEIRLSGDKRVLNVAFDDGGRYALPAEYLRVSSPSAEVQGHSPAERKVIGGKRAVAILEIQPVGNYAVKLGFDDMHDTGIFGWNYLHELGREYDSRWATYLDELAERGLDRETAKVAPIKGGTAAKGGCGSGGGGAAATEAGRGSKKGRRLRRPSSFVVQDRRDQRWTMTFVPTLARV